MDDSISGPNPSGTQFKVDQGDGDHGQRSAYQRLR